MKTAPAYTILSGFEFGDIPRVGTYIPRFQEKAAIIRQYALPLSSLLTSRFCSITAFIFIGKIFTAYPYIVIAK